MLCVLAALLFSAFVGAVETVPSEEQLEYESVKRLLEGCFQRNRVNAYVSFGSDAMLTVLPNPGARLPIADIHSDLNKCIDTVTTRFVITTVQSAANISQESVDTQYDIRGPDYIRHPSWFGQQPILELDSGHWSSI